MSISTVPKISVLMAVYNGLPYLREAIESVLFQTIADFEFLIIDDASTDDSVACIRSYQDPRIRLVQNEHNLGTSRTLNKGLKLSRAPYVARLDQDDVCLPDRLQEQLLFLEKRPDIALVCSWEYGIDSHGRKIRNWRMELENFGAFVGPLVVGKCPIWHPSITFRRQAVIDVGGYDQSYAPAEDFELSMRFAMRRYNAAIVPKYLVMQRQHEMRQSVQREAAQWKKTQQCHDVMIKTFCDTPEVELVALLLRMPSEILMNTPDSGDGFWSRCRSKWQLGAVLRALHGMLANMRTDLRLSKDEFTTLTRVVNRRLGAGARWGGKMVFLPTIFFYPIFFCLSPLLVPQIRRLASLLYQKIHALQYPGTLIQSCWQRLGNGRHH
jgi:glycosyltransferase involved in cell wall biosynthesis